MGAKSIKIQIFMKPTSDELEAARLWQAAEEYFKTASEHLYLEPASDPKKYKAGTIKSWQKSCPANHCQRAAASTLRPGCIFSSRILATTSEIC